MLRNGKCGTRRVLKRQKDTHLKLDIEQHESHKNPGVKSGAWEGYAAPVPHVALVVY
jgi:uncharacterized protein involved in high-affinity Fe2+ transport